MGQIHLIVCDIDTKLSNTDVKHPYKVVRMSWKLKMLKIWFENKKTL